MRYLLRQRHINEINRVRNPTRVPATNFKRLRMRFRRGRAFPYTPSMQESPQRGFRSRDMDVSAALRPGPDAFSGGARRAPSASFRRPDMSGTAPARLVLSLPQALAARHVSETVIASTTAIVVSPTIYSFLLGPILDVRFSRRAYATALTIVSATMLGVSVLSIESAFLLKVAATSPDEAT